MNKLQNRKNIYITIAILTLVLIGIGYAVITSNLSISGSTNVKKNTWDVHFENIKKLQGSATSTVNIPDDTTINYSATLKHVGDYLEFTVDVVNKGSFDAMITSISSTGLTAEQQKYLKYTVSYDSGVEIAKRQILEKETGKETIRIRVEYKSDLDESDLPTQTSGISLSLTINYGEAENAVAITHPTCKRATILHTELCNNNSYYNACAHSYFGSPEYNLGDTITYGLLGTPGTLTRGDAFDCDVNGDKKYDPKTERFYYVNDLEGNNNYGVLLYYSNVANGVADNTYTNSYCPSGKASTQGPCGLIGQLPTTAQWSNVNLSNSNRTLRTSCLTSGCGEIIVSFNGYAARLLENNLSSCYSTSSQYYDFIDQKKCNFLLENTKYSNNSSSLGYWLETMGYSTGHFFAYGLNGGSKQVRSDYDITSATSYLGVRPVIEVEKSKISY